MNQYKKLEIVLLTFVVTTVGLVGYEFMTAGSCWGKSGLGDRLLADPLARLKAKHQVARAREQAEISRLEKEIAQLKARATRSDNTLDMMLTIVHQRKELQKQLAKLKKKQKKAEAKRQAEIKRLKEKIKKDDIRKYQEIASSPFGEDLKKAALKALIAKYPEVAKDLGIVGPRMLPRKTASGAITNSLGMKFVLIPAGTFIMGSPVNELTRDNDEKQHQVTLTKDFYIQTTEVTQGQWREIMGRNPSNFKNCGDDCPVESVSWNDCQKFILRLNKHEGTNTYRLPTEAEWEYVCRSGSTTAFFNGDIQERECGPDPNLDQIGWYCGNSNKVTHPVAQSVFAWFKTPVSQ